MPYAETNGHNIHFTDTKDTQAERGDGSPPVVMIHGLGSSQNYYMPVIPFIEKYRCIALDTFGAGRSKSQGEELSLQQMAEDVVGLISHLKIANAIVIGHSVRLMGMILVPV